MVYIRRELCDLRFTQKSISSKLRNGKSLESFAVEIAECTTGIDDVELIKVVNHAGLTFSLDNRRLAIFRLLHMTGIVGDVLANKIEKPRSEWSRKFDMQDMGVSIIVRGIGYVIGLTAVTTTFPLGMLRAKRQSALHGPTSFQPYHA